MSATVQLSFDFSDRDLQSTESKFQSVLECLNSIPYLNSGGCGISALAIYRWCKANNVSVSDRPFVFLWREYDGDVAQENDARLFNGEIDRVEAPSHVAIELADGLYDSAGRESSVLFEYCTCAQSYKLDEDELLNVINRTEEWNPTFRRSNVRKIEYALGIDLSDVEV